MISVPTINVSRARGGAAADRGARRAGRRGADAHARRPHGPHAARLPAADGAAARGAACCAGRSAPATSSARWSSRRSRKPGNILSSRLHERAERLHGDDAAAVAAESGHRHVDRGATTAYLQFGTDKDYVFCVESEFLHERTRREAARLLPAAARSGVAAGDSARRCASRDPTACRPHRSRNAIARSCARSPGGSIRRTRARTTTSACCTTTRGCTRRRSPRS